MHKKFENKKYQKITNLSLKFKKYYYLGNIIVWVRYFLKYILSLVLMLQLNQTYEYD